MDYVQEVVDKLVYYGKSTGPLRAMVLSSSLANPSAPADAVSDFDIEFFFDDPAPFVEKDDWLETMGFGPLMAIWHWPNEWDHEPGSGQAWMRMVYYLDGTKMDITLAYTDNLRKICRADTLPEHYDIGYKVLLDKDDVTAPLKPPTYQAYIIKPPTQDQFASRMETFWMNTTYAARYLWREDIVGTKWRMHELADRGLREVLEWSVAMERSWDWKPGNLGRGLDKVLSPDVRQELIETYAAGGIDDLWESLFRTANLFRKTATRLAERLGFPYPHDLDQRITTYYRVLRGLDKQTGTREQLARLLKESYHGDS